VSRLKREDAPRKKELARDSSRQTPEKQQTAVPFRGEMIVRSPTRRRCLKIRVQKSSFVFPHAKIQLLEKVLQGKKGFATNRLLELADAWSEP